MEPAIAMLASFAILVPIFFFANRHEKAVKAQQAADRQDHCSICLAPGRHLSIYCGRCAYYVNEYGPYDARAVIDRLPWGNDR